MASVGVRNAGECHVVDDAASLYYLPGALYRGPISRSDIGIRELASIWPPMTAFTDILHAAIDRREPGPSFRGTSIDFGAYRTSKVVSEGYVWCTVFGVFFRRELAVASANCGWHEGSRRSECIVRRYGEALAHLGMTVRETGARARIEFGNVLMRMHHARLAEMGEAIDSNVPSALRDRSDALADAENLLSDPLASLAIGGSPGRGGGLPAGFTAAKRLVDAGKVDALRRVLRGPNPEGRGFAAVALSKLGALSRHDLRVIQRLRVGSSIDTQHGCMGYSVPAPEFFDNLSIFHRLFRAPQMSL